MLSWLASTRFPTWSSPVTKAMLQGSGRLPSVPWVRIEAHSVSVCEVGSSPRVLVQMS